MDVPRAMRLEMLNRIHTGHLGIQKCKKRARYVLFWPTNEGADTRVGCYKNGRGVVEIWDTIEV